MSKFIGEYRMRNGWVAHVKFVLPDPHSSLYPLFGYYYNEISQTYQPCCWTLSGKAIDSKSKHAQDLMLPRREVWIPYYSDGSRGITRDIKPVMPEDVEIVHFVEAE